MSLISEKQALEICERWETATLEEVRQAYDRIMINAPCWAWSDDEETQRWTLRKAMEGPSQ